MTTIALALDALLNHPEVPLEQAVAEHFGPGYRQRTNGTWDEREGFVAHIAHLRTLVRHVHIDVLEELMDGAQYADRHVVRIEKLDGSTVVQEVYLFGELEPDGRFGRIEETTLMLSGAESDRGIGNAR